MSPVFDWFELTNEIFQWQFANYRIAGYFQGLYEFALISNVKEELLLWTVSTCVILSKCFKFMNLVCTTKFLSLENIQQYGSLSDLTLEQCYTNQPDF